MDDIDQVYRRGTSTSKVTAAPTSKPNPTETNKRKFCRNSNLPSSCGKTSNAGTRVVGGGEAPVGESICFYWGVFLKFVINYSEPHWRLDF